MLKRSLAKNTNQQSGFTILELLLVLIVIIILIAFIGTTYAGIREKERNTTRQDNLALIKSSLELYYAENYKYPTLGNMNSPTWIAQNLQNFNNALLKDPSSSSETLVAAPKPHAYAYIVTGADGSACNNITVQCAQYTLTATLEGGGTFSQSSLS